MHGQIDGRMKRLVDQQKDGWMGGWMDGSDGWMAGWVRWANGWMDE